MAAKPPLLKINVNCLVTWANKANGEISSIRLWKFSDIHYDLAVKQIYSFYFFKANIPDWLILLRKIILEHFNMFTNWTQFIQNTVFKTKLHSHHYLIPSPQLFWAKKKEKRQKKLSFCENVVILGDTFCL